MDPSGKWIAASEYVSPIGRLFPQVIREDEGTIQGLAFAPDGSFLVSASQNGSVAPGFSRTGKASEA
jgi:hypothetical protein